MNGEGNNNKFEARLLSDYEFPSERPIIFFIDK